MDNINSIMSRDTRRNPFEYKHLDPKYHTVGAKYFEEGKRLSRLYYDNGADLDAAVKDLLARRDADFEDVNKRVVAVVENPIIKYFKYHHLPANLQEVSKPFCELAELLDGTLVAGPEKSVALRKLLESKDAAVRAALES